MKYPVTGFPHMKGSAELGELRVNNKDQWQLTTDLYYHTNHRNK